MTASVFGYQTVTGTNPRCAGRCGKFSWWHSQWLQYAGALLLAAALAFTLSSLAAKEVCAEQGARADGAPTEPDGPVVQGSPEAGQPSEDGLQAPPKNWEQRTQALKELYGRLATATDARQAAPLAAAIERIWLFSGSDTIAVLMERSLDALSNNKPELALKLLDAVVELAPDFAEGWNRRAVVHYMQKDYTRALGDLRRVLALEPNHFKALEGLGQILTDVGQKRGALEAYRQLKKVHPHWSGADQMLKELEREVEGIGI